MPVSEATKKANNKWNDANHKTLYDRINVLAPKGKRETVKAAALQHEQTASAYIMQAIDKRMERDCKGDNQNGG